MSTPTAEIMRRELTLQPHDCQYTVYGNDCGFCDRIFKLLPKQLEQEYRTLELKKHGGNA